MTTPSITYRAVREDDIETVRTFLARLGWAERVSDPARVRAMLVNANRTIVALDGTTIVGFGRALCDGVSNGYISTVAVAEDYRGKGIGRRLVEDLMGGDDDRITWVLRSGRGSDGFWLRLGFKPSTIAMERTRAK